MAGIKGEDCMGKVKISRKSWKCIPELPTSRLHSRSRIVVNLRDDASSPIRTNLRENMNLGDIKPQRDNRVAAAAHTLPNHPLYRLCSRFIHQVRKVAQLAANCRPQESAYIGSPIAGAHRDAVYGSEDTDDVVARDIVHRRCDDAMGVNIGGRNLNRFFAGRCRM